MKTRLDVGSGYPTIQRILGLSKETTSHEVSIIEGIDRPGRRTFGVNLLASHVNAVELLQQACKAPKMEDLLERFNAAHTNQPVSQDNHHDQRVVGFG